tara:strand:+ start:3309 stop:4487 length:1179 start_codon:yes stop_codon:yes gene_type:complete
MLQKIGLYLFLFFCLLGCRDGAFTWNLKSKPDVSDILIVSNVLDSVFIQADLKSNGHTSSTLKGFCWSDSNSEPTLNDKLILIDGSSEGIYSAAIAWDTSSQVKYVRAFAQNGLGLSYSKTLALFWPVDDGNAPVVKTISVEDISFYSAEVNGKLESNGGIPWTSFGVLLSENPAPSISNSIISYSTLANNDFTITYNELSENTVYYTRAFAENDGGIGYGEIISFTTRNFFEIGEPGPAGGIIFYNKLDSTGGWNFLEIFSTDVVELLPWSETVLSVNTSTEIGIGHDNTESIYDSQAENIAYAARFCLDFSSNGASDWFLPSRDELLLVYNNLFINGLGGFNNGNSYWSSSQDGTFSQNSWIVDMNNNSSNTCTSEYKLTMHGVRPIRKF